MGWYFGRCIACIPIDNKPISCILWINKCYHWISPSHESNCVTDYTGNFQSYHQQIPRTCFIVITTVFPFAAFTILLASTTNLHLLPCIVYLALMILAINGVIGAVVPLAILPRCTQMLGNSLVFCIVLKVVCNQFIF